MVKGSPTTKTLIVAERINSTRKSIAEAIARRDAEFIQKEALDQVEGGAHYIDVNAGAFSENEPELLVWLVNTVQEVTDKPLSIDTVNAEAAEAALKVHRGKAILNSTTGERARSQAFLPLVKEYGCGIVALCLDDNGTPRDVAGRLGVAARIIDMFTGAGVAPGDIYIDPLVHPLGVETDAGQLAVDTIAGLAREYPEVATIVGLSNVSFGLPYRAQVNRVFLLSAVAKGLKAAILDPTNKRIMADLITIETVLGWDPYCMNYLKSYRAGKIKIDQA